MSPQELQHLRQRRTSMDGVHQRTHASMNKETTTIAVIGLGYVGLPLSILAASRDFTTIGFDIDEIKAAQLEKREANFLDDEDAVAFKRAKKLSITANPADLDNANVFIVCVPTPVHENTHLPDLQPLESAAEIVGQHLKAGGLVVIESTVSPGACEEVALPIIEKHSKLTREEFSFAHCPERINPGDPKWNVASIPRVIGGRDSESLSDARALYATLIDADVFPMGSIKEAEAVKMVENSFRDINIAFVNELAMAFDRAGIDLVNVIKGASTKPFGFMAHYPGCGVGGYCIPVDPYYLIRSGHENGFEHQFLMTARRINNHMPHYAVDLLSDALRTKRKRLKGATIALLGLSYKKDVPDMRESSALVIRDILEKKGANVRTYDPFVASTGADLKDTLSGADAAIIATDHTVFASLTARQFEELGVDIVIDGRNCLDKSTFAKTRVIYHGIGRS